MAINLTPEIEEALRRRRESYSRFQEASRLAGEWEAEAIRLTKAGDFEEAALAGAKAESLRRLVSSYGQPEPIPAEIVARARQLATGQVRAEVDQVLTSLPSRASWVLGDPAVLARLARNGGGWQPAYSSPEQSALELFAEVDRRAGEVRSRLLAWERKDAGDLGAWLAEGDGILQLLPGLRAFAGPLREAVEQANRVPRPGGLRPEFLTGTGWKWDGQVWRKEA